MSRSRLLLRLLLVLLLAGIGVLAIRQWLLSGSDSTWQQAEQAFATGDLATAKIHLLNLLRDHPNHGAGHALMGKVLLAEGENPAELTTNGTAITPLSSDYSTHAEARQHLKAAARLQPNNLPLQQELLQVFLDRGAIEAAAEVAETIRQQTSNGSAKPNANASENADVQLALAAQAASLRHLTKAQALLEQYFKQPTRHRFRAYQIALAMARSEAGSPENGLPQQEKVFDDAITASSHMSATELLELPLQEQLIMADLLYQAVAYATTVERAHQRAAQVVALGKQLMAANARATLPVATLIARIVQQLRTNYPHDKTVGKVDSYRQQVVTSALQLLQQAATAQVAEPAIYRELGLAAIESRAYEQATTLLTTGLAACSELAQTHRSELEGLHLLTVRSWLLLQRYDEATTSLETLRQSDDSRLAGWGELLAGGIASAQGRHGHALRCYQRAQSKLGRVPQIDIALASSYVRLGNWHQALPRLQALPSLLANNDAELQTWARLHGLSTKQAKWHLFRGHLALDEWELAQADLANFASTQLAVQGEVLAARYLVRKGRSNDALQRVRAALETSPESLALQQMQISLLQEVGRDSEAEEQTEQLLAKLASVPTLNSQLLLAHWRERQGRLEDALAVLAQAETRFASSPQLQLLKAQLLLAQGETRQALEIGRTLQASPQGQSTGQVIELMHALHEGQLDTARAQVVELASNRSTTSHPRLNLLSGQLTAASGNLPSAIQQMGELLDVTSLERQTNLTLLRAVLQLAVEEGPAAASAALAPLLKQHPHAPFLKVIEADLLFRQQRIQEGLATLDRVEQLLPESPTVAYLKATTWAQLGQYDKALQEVQRSLATQEHWLPARQLAAQLELATGHAAKALRHAELALQQDHRPSTLHFLKAAALQQLGRNREAIDLFSELVAQAPQLLAPSRGLMALWLAEDQPQQALAVCQQARKALPNETTLAIDEIAIHCRLNEVTTAEQLAKQQWQAIDHQQAAMATDFCLAVSQTFGEADQFEPAWQWAEQALEVADTPQRPAAALLLGELALRHGQATSDRTWLATASDYFEQVLQQQPRHLVAGNNLAWLLAIEFGKTAQAERIVDTVRGDMSAGNLPLPFVDTLAVVYRRAEKYDKARGILEEALARHPQQPVLLHHLGIVLAQTGQPAAARQLLEQALSLESLSDPQIAEAQQILATLP